MKVQFKSETGEVSLHFLDPDLRLSPRCDGSVAPGFFRVRNEGPASTKGRKAPTGARYGHCQVPMAYCPPSSRCPPGKKVRRFK